MLIATEIYKERYDFKDLGNSKIFCYVYNIHKSEYLLFTHTILSAYSCTLQTAAWDDISRTSPTAKDIHTHAEIHFTHIYPYNLSQIPTHIHTHKYTLHKDPPSPWSFTMTDTGSAGCPLCCDCCVVCCDFCVCHNYWLPSAPTDDFQQTFDLNKNNNKELSSSTDNKNNIRFSILFKSLSICPPMIISYWNIISVINGI